jgi:RNA polymerase sigma factor (sigma-70 family)
MKPTKVLLTPKERQVLQLLSKGFTYKEISKPMEVSPETVKRHLKNIYKKLNAGNKIEALQKVKLL